MSRGPLPDPNSRRRNKPTIPTTSLPAGGRKGRIPKVPASYALLTAGTAWWRWAWTLPQAAAWDDGSHYALARRAQLEDTMAALAVDDARGRLSVLKEMRELDRRFGLDPKAMAELRWTIVAEEAPAAKPAPARKRHLRAVGE
jgi:hypothetical protein